MLVATLAIVLASCVASTTASDAPSFSADAGAFDAAVADLSASKPLLALFHSPQCGHCAAMMPEWEKIAADLNESENAEPNFAIAAVDATSEKELARRFDVNGYPTILAIQGSAVYEFSGEREKAEMLQFVQDPPSLGKKRGYIGADGVVRPSQLDQLMRTHTDANDIRERLSCQNSNQTRQRRHASIPSC